jgi:tetratricopeptide (TPR) repeat protein
MYKTRINSWNLHKNLKKAQKATLFQKVREKHGVEKLLPNGRPLMPRLLRYCRENKVELQAIGAATSTNRQRRVNSILAASSHADAAALEVQSLFRPASQPSRPIAMHGDMRNAEAIKWYTEAYLDSYLTTGPGTLYYQLVPVEPACENGTAQSLTWTRNESAWSNVENTVDLIAHVIDAMQALKWGFSETAFEAVGKAQDLLLPLFKQQAPHLLSELIEILAVRASGHSKFARNLRKFIFDMAATVLGTAHPLSMIISILCKFSSMADQLRVWCAVTDSYNRLLSVVKDSGTSEWIRWSYYWGLFKGNLMYEAQDYLEVMFSGHAVLREQNAQYMSEKASLLRSQGKYVEADFQYRRCLELLKEAEDDIVAYGRNSTFLDEWRNIDDCLYGLAHLLENADRMDEAKVMLWRSFKFNCAALGPDSIDAQIAGASLDDFLIGHGYLEESATLRAQYPPLLRRNEIPPECL